MQNRNIKEDTLCIRNKVIIVIRMRKWGREELNENSLVKNELTPSSDVYYFFVTSLHDNLIKIQTLQGWCSEY